MKLRAKVVVATRQWAEIAWASTLAASTCFDEVLLKFVTSKDCQAALRRRKGLAGIKLGLDKDLTLAQ
jgi:hypothetical protein